MMKKEINKHTPNPKQSMRRQQRGNTLVPVIIAITLAAIATVTFLNQGADLTERNNANLAINEITKHLTAYNIFRSNGTTVATSIDNIPGLTTANGNAYGNTNTDNDNGIVFVTDSADDCTLLSNLLPEAGNLNGVSAYSCGNDPITANLTLTLN